MSLESVFRLSLIMNMIDNLTGPMAGVTSSVNGTVSKLQKANAALGNMAKTLMHPDHQESILQLPVP